MSNAALSVLFLVTFAGCGDPANDLDAEGDDTGTVVGDPVVVEDLDTVMGDTHEPVPLTLLASHHLAVTVSSPVGDLRFFVDSGASTTVISQQLAGELGVSAAPNQPVAVDGLLVGSTPVDYPIVVVDLTSTNAALVAGGELPIDGLVGAPFLNENQAVIAYPGPTLYIATDTAPRSLARELGDALTGSGYDTIDIATNLIQFVELDAVIDGSARLNAIVDTGAGATLVEVAAANRLGLDLVPAQTGAATIGGAIDTYQTSVGELVLGDHPLHDRTLLVVDLGAANAQLAQVGLDPIEVLTGADVLSEQAGVLDYVGSRLFLLPE